MIVVFLNIPQYFDKDNLFFGIKFLAPLIGIFWFKNTENKGKIKEKLLLHIGNLYLKLENIIGTILKILYFIFIQYVCNF